jgi:hypothetical protein
MRRLLATISVAALALIAVAAAVASDPTKEKIARTPAGNAAAVARVLKKADLPAGWKGGATKPTLGQGLGCSSYKPKQSDLVVVGAAMTTWKRLPSTIDSEIQVLRTPRMVKLDWQRTVADRRVLPCLRQGFAKHASPGETLVSLGWVSVPRLATYTREYRLVVKVATQSGSVRVAVQALVFGAGRIEDALIVSGLASQAGALEKLQLQLARRLAKRL